eukprot:gb/GECG01003677.1/.p1 GENE.gb/GECG01003677.1/~~gb/GECG01003677.1/.p1  ORF type:complete len:246 (+),score=4.83 gb/GECG01003677.1/:1-738(+)
MEQRPAAKCNRHNATLYTSHLTIGLFGILLYTWTILAIQAKPAADFHPLNSLPGALYFPLASLGVWITILSLFALYGAFQHEFRLGRIILRLHTWLLVLIESTVVVIVVLLGAYVLDGNPDTGGPLRTTFDKFAAHNFEHCCSSIENAHLHASDPFHSKCFVSVSSSVVKDHCGSDSDFRASLFKRYHDMFKYLATLVVVSLFVIGTIAHHQKVQRKLGARKHSELLRRFEPDTFQDPGYYQRMY